MVIFMKPYSETNFENLKKRVVDRNLQIFHHGNKIYISSKLLNKGKAIERFLNTRKYDYVLVAGDEVVDISMAKYADEIFFDDKLAEICLSYKDGILNKNIQFLNKYEIADAILGR